MTDLPPLPNDFSSLSNSGQNFNDGSYSTTSTRQHTEVAINASQPVENDDDHNQVNLDEDAPTWTELKTKAGKDRKRLPLACISCRRKKIKCSGEKPACKHCVKARTPCVYKTTTRKAAPRVDYMVMLDRRLKRMEDRVMRILPVEELPDTTQTGRSWVRPTLPGESVPKEKLGLDQQIKRQAFVGGFDEVQLTETRERMPHSGGVDNKLLREGIEALPPTELQLHLAEVFFDCVYGQSYLLLHKPSFMRKLKSNSVPPVLMLAVCAIAARFTTHPQLATEPAFLRGEQWATPARKIVEQRHFEPNITILTVMIILGLHYFGTCEGGLSWSFGGQAMRMAYALQLHKELHSDSQQQATQHRASRSGSAEDRITERSSTDREIRRRTMWACLLMDIFNSSGTERPPFLDEEYISIRLPMRESLFQREIPDRAYGLGGDLLRAAARSPDQTESDTDIDIGVAAYVVKAVILWKRIVKYLNLGGRKRDPKPPWDPSSQFSALVEEVTQLRHGLPSSLVYSAENLAAHAVERIANQFLFLHALIAQSELFLHRFALPTPLNQRLPSRPDIPKSFLSDAMKVCLEAATQISRILADSSGHSFTVPFAGYCAYTSATLHIWAMFGGNEEIRHKSKDNLRHNLRYLSDMKRYWGMMHYMVESIKNTYRTFADAAHRTAQRRASRLAMTPGSTHNCVTPAPAPGDSPLSDEHRESGDEILHANSAEVLQYSDWFERHPTGMSRSEWERERGLDRSEHALVTDAVMSQRSELQSVEEFFASHSLPSRVKESHLTVKAGRYNTKEPNTRARVATSAVKPVLLAVDEPEVLNRGAESNNLDPFDRPSVYEDGHATVVPQSDAVMDGRGQGGSHVGLARQLPDVPVHSTHLDAANLSNNADKAQMLNLTRSYNLSDTMYGDLIGTSTQPATSFDHLAALPQLDRLMALDGCIGIDSSSTGATNALNDSGDLGFWSDSWNTQVDMDGFDGTDTLGRVNLHGEKSDDTGMVMQIGEQSTFGLNEPSTSAWFMPFNLDPPDAEHFYAYDSGVQGINYGLFGLAMEGEESNMFAEPPYSPAHQS